MQVNQYDGDGTWSKKTLISKAELLSITDAEVHGGTSRFFPKPGSLPSDFTYPNIYTNAIESALGIRPRPEARLILRKGYEGIETFLGIQKFIQSHLPPRARSTSNILAIALVLSKICEINSIQPLQASSTPIM